MPRLSFRLLTLIGCIFGAALTAFWVGAPRGVDGLLFDLLVVVCARLWADMPSAQPEPVAVIALDQRSLEAPELAPYLRTFLASVWATLLESVFSAGARAVGFGMLFAYSANRFVRDPVRVGYHSREREDESSHDFCAAGCMVPGDGSAEGLCT